MAPTRLERREAGQYGTLEETMAEGQRMTDYSNHQKPMVPTLPDLKPPVRYLIFHGTLKIEAVLGILQDGSE